MRERIKEVATEMLTRHGYLGLRFQQISDVLNVTRGNIHYHFGSKAKLADEVIAEYTQATLAVLEDIWSDRGITLEEKITRTMLFNKQRYLKFNPTEKTANAWSLIARMRLEREVLPPRSQKALQAFNSALERVISEGVRVSIEKGELAPDAPAQQISLHLVLLCSSSDPITQDAGTFDRLVDLYRGFGEIIQHAYGNRGGASLSAPEKARKSVKA